MASMKGPNKTVLGLFVDGFDIKLAHLSIKGKKVTVHELRSATLVSKLEERKPMEISALVGADGGDAFSLPGAVPETGGGGDDNDAVLLGLLAQYPARKYSLAYAISEPALYYHPVESDFGLKGKKLKERLLEELRGVRAFQPASDAVDHIRTDEGGVLSIVREDGLTLINSLENVKSYIGNRLPRIPVIDSADVSLMNMVRMNYAFDPGEVAVLIYVGVEYTRLIFMRGNEFHQFAPILGEGYDSPNLQNTVFSRLLLEQDNLAIPRISKIILAGESRRIGLKEFLTQQLPDQEVDYLLAPSLDLSELPPDQHEAVSEYAVPIGTAMRVLATGNKKLYEINLLPSHVREGQRVFKLGWHGYLLLALLFASTLFFTWQIAKKTQEIKDQGLVLQVKQSQIEENQTLQNSIQSIEAQIARFQTSMALYDSLVPGADRWSKAMTQLSHGIEDLNSLWVTDFSTGGGGLVTMNGFAVYRTRIPRMASLFESSLLKEVIVREIREQTVYNYKIEVPQHATGN